MSVTCESCVKSGRVSTSGRSLMKRVSAECVCVCVYVTECGIGPQIPLRLQYVGIQRSGPRKEEVEMSVEHLNATPVAKH
jgi:hypothetical protein